VFVILTVNFSNSTLQQHIPKFRLNFESFANEKKSTSYNNDYYTFSHYNDNMSEGSIQYPEQSNHLSRKDYKPKEIVTFTVNIFPYAVEEKPTTTLQVNITQMDIETSSNCSYDSLTFLTPIISSNELIGPSSLDYR
jgi:hypothetical protein